MNVAGSFHLWLEPTEEAASRLRREIDRLAKAHGATAFEPHVTLLPFLQGTEAELVERTQRLAARLRPWRLQLTGAGTGEDYYQCVFMRVAQEPALEAARAVACEVFAHPGGTFMPHLSLLYGDHDGPTRNAIAASVPADLQLEFAVQGITLLRSDSDDPQDWQQVATPRFGSALT